MESKIDLNEFKNAEALSPSDLANIPVDKEMAECDELAEIEDSAGDVVDAVDDAPHGSDENKESEQNEELDDFSYSAGGYAERPETGASEDLPSQEAINIDDIGQGSQFAEMSLLDFSEEVGQSTVVSQAEKDLEELSEHYEGTLIEMNDLKNRLRRRTSLIEQLRLAYLKDVVTIKQCLQYKLTDPERKAVLDEYTGRLPSVDLSEELALYAPQNAHMRVKPCEECGGVVDITMNDSEHVAKLTSLIEKYKEKEERLRLTIATQDATTDSMVAKHNAESRQHAEEKRFLYGEMKRLKTSSAKIEAENQRLSQATVGYREDIRTKAERITMLEGKASKLIEVEAELVQTKLQLGSVTGTAEANDTKVTELQIELDAEKVAHSQKVKIIAERDQTIEKYVQSVEESEVAIKKLREINKYLDETQTELSNQNLVLTNKLADLAEEKRFFEEETAVEMENLQKIAEDARAELSVQEAKLEESQKETFAVQGALSAAEGLIAQKEHTIANRDKEIMAMAAENEAQAEELSALKLFVADTVKGRSTPGKKHRSAPGVDNTDDGDDGDDDNETFGDDDVSWVEEADHVEPAASLDAGSDFIEPKHASSQSHNSGSNEALGMEISAPAPNLDDVDLAEYKRKQLMRQSGGQADAVREGEVQPQRSYALPEPSVATDDGSVGASSVMSTPSVAPPSAVSVPAPAPVEASPLSQGPSVNTTNEYTETTVAPVTQQSPPKKKNVHARDDKPKKQIALLPPTENAECGELMLRKEFMDSIHTTLGSNGSKKAMNAARMSMATFGAFMTNSMKTLWESTLMAKRAADLVRRIETFTSSVLTCTNGDVTSDHVAEMIKELVPKIGSNYNFSFSEEWQDEISMDEQFANLLDPSLDKENDIVFYKDFTALFGDSKEEYLEGVEDTAKQIEAIREYHDKRMYLINSQLCMVLKDWSAAKLQQLDLDSRIAAEREEVRSEMQVIIDDLKKELGLSNGRFDAAKAFSKSLEIKMETISKRLVDLEALPEKLAIAESECENLKRTKEAQAQSIEEYREEIKAKKEEFAILSAAKEEADDTIHHMEDAINNSSADAVKFEQKMIFERQLKEQAQASLAANIEAESLRVSSMQDKATDCTSLMRDFGNQTDFLTPEMSVRTTFATGAGTIYARKPFGVSLVDTSKIQQSWDIVTHMKTQAGAGTLGPYATTFLNNKKSMVTPKVPEGLPLSPSDSYIEPRADPAEEMNDDMLSIASKADSIGTSNSALSASMFIKPTTHIQISVPNSGGNSPVRTAEMNTGEYVDGLSTKILTSMKDHGNHAPGRDAATDMWMDEQSVESTDQNSILESLSHFSGRQSQRQKASGVAEYSKIFASAPLRPGSRSRTPSSPGPTHNRNLDINPVDMLELARARLAVERSERSGGVRRGRDGAGFISPLKAAGMSASYDSKPASADSTGFGMTSSIVIDKYNRIVPPGGVSGPGSTRIARDVHALSASKSLDHLPLSGIFPTNSERSAPGTKRSNFRMAGDKPIGGGKERVGNLLKVQKQQKNFANQQTLSEMKAKFFTTKE